MAEKQDKDGPSQQSLFPAYSPPATHGAKLRMRSRLIGKAAHEIYNATTPLVANLTTLRGDILADEFEPDLAVEMLDECLEGIGRTTDVLKRVRELCRTDGPLRNDEVDLAAILRHVCDDLSHRKGLQLELHAQSVWVRGDGGILTLIVERLIRSWLSRLPGLEASVGLGIGLYVREQPGHGELEIRDQRNVDLSEDFSKLFDAFQQGDSLERGTWLFLCRSLVEDMGGRLEASLEAGNAVLRLRLPRDEA